MQDNSANDHLNVSEIISKFRKDILDCQHLFQFSIRVKQLIEDLGGENNIKNVKFSDEDRGNMGQAFKRGRGLISNLKENINLASEYYQNNLKTIFLCIQDSLILSGKDSFQKSAISFLNDVFDMAKDHFKNFAPQSLSLTILKVGKSNYSIDKDVLRSWFSGANGKLREFNSQNLSNSISALPKLKENGVEIDPKDIKGFLKQWLFVAGWDIKKFNSQELTNSIFALAELKENGVEIDLQDLKIYLQGWFKASLEKNRSNNKEDRFTSQGLSNSIYAIAKLVEYGAEIAPEDLKKFRHEWFHASIHTMNSKEKNFTSQGLSNSIYAIAKLVEYGDENELRSTQKHIPAGRPDIAAEDMGNYMHEWFLNEWFKASIKTMQSGDKENRFNAQGLSNSIYALAGLKEYGVEIDLEYSEKYLHEWFKVSKEAMISNNKNERFTPQNLSNSIYALAKLKEYGAKIDSDEIEGFVKLWLSVGSNDIKKFNSQELSNSILALAKLKENGVKIDDEDLEKYLSEWFSVSTEKIQSDNKKERPNSQNLSNFIYALAKSIEYGVKADPEDLKKYLSEWFSVSTEKIQSDDEKERFNSIELATSILAVAKLVEHKVEIEPIGIKKYLKGWLSTVKSRAASDNENEKFNSYQLCNSIYAIASLVERGGITVSAAKGVALPLFSALKIEELEAEGVNAIKYGAGVFGYKNIVEKCAELLKQNRYYGSGRDYQ